MYKIKDLGRMYIATYSYWAVNDIPNFYLKSHILMSSS